MNKQQLKLSLILEGLGWLVTVLLILLVLFPILKAYKEFPYLTMNIIFIVVFVTYTRYIFLLKHALFAKNWLIKLFILFGSLPLIFYLTSNHFEFQAFLDESGPYALVEPSLLVKPLGIEEAKKLSSYVSNEMLFFAIGSIIAAIIMPFRMMISIWLVYNRDRV